MPGFKHKLYGVPRPAKVNGARIANIYGIPSYIKLGNTSGSAIYNDWIARVNLDYLTHFFYNSIQPHSTSDMTLEPDYGELAHLTTVVSMAHGAGIKAGVALWDNNTFPTIVDDAGLLATFVDNVVDMVTGYGFDAIMIDSENSNPTNQQRIDMAHALYDAVHPLSVEVFYYGISTPNYCPFGLNPYVDWVQNTFNNSHGFETDDARFTDYTDNLAVLTTAGWDAAKLLTTFQVYAFDASIQLCMYGDVVDAELNPHDSRATIASIYSTFTETTRDVTGGKLYWDGIDLNIRKTDYIKAGGYGGAVFFTSDYDTVPNDDAHSLIRNVYEALT